MELVKLTHENLDREHICCAISNNKDIQVIFFAVDNDRIVGIIDFRHTLNDFLKDLGHCGYSVRPSERRKGFATEMPLLTSSMWEALRFVPFMWKGRMNLRLKQSSGMEESMNAALKLRENRRIFTGLIWRNSHIGTSGTAEPNSQ